MGEPKILPIRVTKEVQVRDAIQAGSVGSSRAFTRVDSKVTVSNETPCMVISQVTSKWRNRRSSVTETSLMEVTVPAELTVSLSPVLSLSGQIPK